MNQLLLVFFLHLVLKALAHSQSLLLVVFLLFNLSLFNLFKSNTAFSHQTVKLNNLSLLWVCAEVYVLDSCFGDRESF